eukprot:6190430-Pleurochrysis_carterae.AAC.5
MGLGVTEDMGGLVSTLTATLPARYPRPQPHWQVEYTSLDPVHLRFPNVKRCSRMLRLDWHSSRRTAIITTRHRAIGRFIMWTMPRDGFP